MKSATQAPTTSHKWSDVIIFSFSSFHHDDDDDDKKILKK
jgi:hypothetical protein